PYGVPKGYFSTLASSVLQQVQPGAELGVYHFEPPHTVQPRIETPYQVPPGYFESMAQEVLQKAKAAALPAVESKPWPTTMPYALPDGYFNQLENQIKEKIATLVPATTLLHHLRKKWVHYAAAAVLVLGALGVYKLVSITPQTQLPGDVAVELPQNQAGMDSLLQGLSLQLSTFEEESLGETLTDLGIPEDSRGPLFYLNTTNFEAALKDFSEEELQQQLVIQNADKASI
ncbi:MAG TPA: hypothetical protein PKD90_06240, partial [Phnomibacter sp.]|nr:hypothetical protein [Phnomibacter sp.]